VGLGVWVDIPECLGAALDFSLGAIGVNSFGRYNAARIEHGFRGHVRSHTYARSVNKSVAVGTDLACVTGER